MLLNQAIRVLTHGGLIAYPTEAVYGLGCLPGCGDAVQRLLTLKGRSAHKGFILIAAALEQLEPLVVLPRGSLREEILQSWPGPFTWVLPARADVPRWLIGRRGTLAVRITGHPVARALCEGAGGALVSTSANRSGRPPLRHVLQVRRELGARVDLVLAGPLGGQERPTTIRDGRTGAVLRA